MALTADLSLSTTGDLSFDGDIALVYDDSLAVQLFRIMFRSEYGDLNRFPHIGMNIKDFMQKQNTKANAESLKDRIYGSMEGVDYLNDYSLILDAYPVDVDDLRLDITMLNPDQEPIDLSVGVDLVHGSVTGLNEYSLDSHNIYANDLTERIEKIKIKTKTNTFKLQFRPLLDVNGDYTINVYNADEFVLEEEDQRYDEDVTLTDNELQLGEFDFKNIDMYTDVLSKNSLVVLYMNDLEIDIDELIDNNWVYEIDSSLLEELNEDSSAALVVYYTAAITSGVLINSNIRSITPEAIAPALEDNYTYDIRTRKELDPGLYYVRYDSYLLKQ